jgi:hypothetical protein
VAVLELQQFVCYNAHKVSASAGSRVITAQLGALVTQWGRARGAAVQPEAAMVLNGSDSCGFLDFLLWWADAAIAVEIDRGNKLRSLRKLQRAAIGIGGLKAGSLWVRWKGTPIAVPADVHLIRPVLG